MKKNASALHHFLALVSQNRVYIVKTKNYSFPRVYRDFYRSPPVGAEEFFLAEQPALYFLETVDLTPSAAYGRRLAWARLWQAHGFTPVSPTVLRGLETGHPDDALHDDAVSAQSFLDIYHPDNDLAAAISLADTDPRIYLTLPKGDLQKLRKSAADVSMTLQEYCMAKIFSRPLPNPNLAELYGCLSHLRQSCTLLDTATKAVLISDQCEDPHTLAALATSLNEEIYQLRQLITALQGGRSYDH